MHSENQHREHHHHDHHHHEHHHPERHPVHIFINKKRYELEHHVQTGEHLKHLAGIPLGDVLFLQRPGEDEDWPPYDLKILRVIPQSVIRFKAVDGLPLPS